MNECVASLSLYYVVQDEWNTFPSHASQQCIVIDISWKLPQTIDLGTGNWEVGFYSISYPHLWYTLQKKDTTAYYTTGEVTA